MSGGKFAMPVLAAAALAQMMLAQHAAGAAAGALRGAAEDEERSKSLEDLRTRFSYELRDAESQLAQPNALLPAHRARLQARHEEIAQAVRQAQTEQELWRAAGELPQLVADINTARMNQRFHLAREAGAQQDQRRQQLLDLDASFADVGTPEMAGLDPSGHDAAARALATARAALEAGAPDANALLDTAAEAIALHAGRGAERKAELMAREAEYGRAATELRAIVAGLRRDPMVSRWQAAAIEEIQAIVDTTPISSETPLVAERVRARAAAVIEAAGKAQLKADTRDYVTESIARSLAEMGFVVGETVAEHPDHPATAKVFQASTASGKSVLVSVPVEGQVWYEVDGYTKTTSAGLGGEMALACDEGERVLEEMHARLDQEFQIEMSEIWWDGKDPNRGLRRADSLPATHGAAQGAAR